MTKTAVQTPFSFGNPPKLAENLEALELTLWAPSAEEVELEIRQDGRCQRVVALKAEAESDGPWHASVEVSERIERLVYRWLVDGDPLLDPYAPLVVGGEIWGQEADLAGGEKPRWSAWKRDTFDWQGVEPPRIDPDRRVVYELTVRGYTRHHSSGVAAPGTFKALIEKIPYWLELGITTLQLLPIAEFDELEFDRRNPETHEPLLNLWGYSPISFFSPKAGLAASSEPAGVDTELKELIRECHRAGLEVVLDVVFNHTGEKELTDADPHYAWAGLDLQGYYLWDAEGKRRDVTGCGNTFATGRRLGREMVLAALRHWRRTYRVDGFRFDLAAALTRDGDGEPMAEPELIREITRDPLLADCLLVAEAWDAAGLYRLGEFPAWGPWAEWNGRFRDTVRAFVRGDAGQTRNLALRLLGSPDLYSGYTAGALHSINYLTCHDGFTLEDVVSYSTKHNLANGEGNRDGDSWSPSWNGGVEGPTEDVRLVQRRRLQVEMMLIVLFLSRGTPMLLAGDEFGRTQGGNNNSYCQDNATGWVDWRRLPAFLDRHELVRRLIELRQRRVSLWSHTLPEGDTVFGRPEIVWHGRSPLDPDWTEEARFLAVQWLAESPEEGDLYVAFNPSEDSQEVQLPEATRGEWLSLETGEPIPSRTRLGPWETLLSVSDSEPRVAKE